MRDQIEKGEISVKYCKTEHRIEVYLTKPLQGTLFHMLRTFILGRKHIDNMGQLIYATLE